MTVRIFVGCSANGEDAEAAAMLEYTLRHYATEPIEITWMTLSHDPASPWYSNPAKREGWNTQGWATPFSAFRWAIPHVCNFEGKAIYMDVDMVVRDDIAKLWHQVIPDNARLLAKDNKHSCVMLFDCARMKAILPPFDMLRRTEGMYRSVRSTVGMCAARFAGNWNCLDGENYKTLTDPDIKVIHFTRVETQPHLKWALPRLQASGQRHWNRLMQPVPHARPDVQPLVDNLWKLAQEAGYTAQRYLPAQPFGRYDAVRGGARAA
jgi:hypothetical protein